jgi:hypothetical protein
MQDLEVVRSVQSDKKLIGKLMRAVHKDRLNVRKAKIIQIWKLKITLARKLYHLLTGS